MRIKENVLLMINGKKGMKQKIAAAMGLSPKTVWRLIKDNHQSLTMAAPLKVIREELKLKDEDILELSVSQEATA